MSYPYYKRLFNSMPVPIRLALMRSLSSARLNQLQNLRTSIVNGYSLKESDELGALFIHVPKNGGTSINRALFDSHGAGHIAFHALELIYSADELNSLFKFSVVRNPWSRLYSSYTYLKKGGGNDFDKRWADENLAEVDSFRDFVLEWLEEERTMSFVHFVPQHFYILDGRGRNRLDYLARFERLNEGFEHITKTLSIDRSLDHLNKSVHTDYREAYDPEMIAKVARVYAKDISEFDYSF